jgi:hypothetical protein
VTELQKKPSGEAERMVDWSTMPNGFLLARRTRGPKHTGLALSQDNVLHYILGQGSLKFLADWSDSRHFSESSHSRFEIIQT